MNIDFSILMALIAFSAFVAVLGFWMQRKDEQTIIPALSLFVSASLFFFLFASIDTVSNTYFASGSPDVYAYNVESFIGNNNMFGGSNVAFAEFVSSTNSELFGKEIDCIDVYLRKVGAPNNIASIGIFADQSTPFMPSTQVFGTFDATMLTTSNEWYSFCLPNGETYTIQNQDRIGVLFTAGDGSNFISIGSDSSNPFDGTITYRQNTDISGPWSSSTINDLTMRLYLRGDNFAITGNTIDMSELKYYFLVIATFLMLTAVYSVKLYKGQGSGEYIDNL